jgi:hypothetical protein
MVINLNTYVSIVGVLGSNLVKRNNLTPVIYSFVWHVL